MQRFSEEDWKLLENFLENKDTAILETDLPKRIEVMYNSYRSLLSDRSMFLARENARLKARVERLNNRHETEYVEGNFNDANIDSGLILKSVYYCLYAHAKGEVPVSVHKAMNIMFEIYAAFLAKEDHTRLFIDKFQAQESGPWVWAAAKQINQPASAYRDSYLALCSQSPTVASVVNNATKKYCFMRESDLKKFICKCPAYRDVDREHNGGKWNGVLDDGKIYLWRKKVLAMRKQQEEQQKK